MTEFIFTRWLFVASLVLFSIGAEERSCQNVGMLVNQWLKGGQAESENLVLKEFTKIPGTMCQLGETCCSHKLEGELRDMVVKDHTGKVRDAINSLLSSCSLDSLISETVTYLESFHRQVIRDLQAVYQSYFRGHEGILDEFFGAFVHSVKTGDASTIEDIYRKTFFNIYLASFFGHPANRAFPKTTKAQACVSEYYIRTEGVKLEEKLGLFMQSFRSLMYYLRGLRASELVVKKLSQLSYSTQCQLSLMKLDRCSACAGYAALRPCKSMCINMLRGCLVDVSDLEQPVTSLSQALGGMNEHFADLDFNQQLVSFEQYIFDLIGSTSNRAFNIRNQIGVCLSSRRKRQSDQEAVSWKREKRQSRKVPRSELEFPLVVYNESTQCLNQRMPGLLVLPESLCGSSASHEDVDCWNGHSNDRYSGEVVPFTRSSQWKNPDVIYCPSPSQFQEELNILHYVARELASITGRCSSDDEDCGSSPTITKYYSFSDAARSRPSASEDDELIDGYGSGSGSGEDTSSACGQVISNDEENKVTPQLLSSSSTCRSSTFLLLTLALTALMAALSSL